MSIMESCAEKSNLENCSKNLNMKIYSKIPNP